MATATASNPSTELVHDISGFVANPLGFALYAYPWGEPELAEKGPRAWQTTILEELGRHLKQKPFEPFRGAIASGHGIGKSALVGMITHWALSTCEDARVTITANTEPQLRTKTWPEISKWFQLGINQHWFTINRESITIRNKQHEQHWRADRLTWTVENAQAFAGLHNIGKRIVVIFDEASEIADEIWEVTQGALTDEGTEILWLVFGNPTQPMGRFAECFGRDKHRWARWQVDSRNVEGTNKAEIAKWIEDYGEDSDYVRIRVRGEFPRAGSNQFIPADVVARARSYQSEGHAGLPKLLSVDVARFGDDQTVIGMRQGRKLSILAKLRGLDTVQVTHRVIDWIKSEQPHAVVVDGDGLGAGVVDQLKHLGYGHRQRIFEFHGNDAPNDPRMYRNQRAECWGKLRLWLKDSADIPDDAELATDLCGPQYLYSPNHQIQLESKEDMKKRGLASPDCGDMAAMTFAVDVHLSEQAVFEERLNHALQDIEEPHARAMYAAKQVGERQKQMAKDGNYGRLRWQRR